MNEPLVNVTLTGPAKIDGKRQPAGTSVAVSILTALQLAASGSINPEAAQALAQAAAMPETALASDFQAAVSAAIAEREAHWSTAMDHFETMAEDRQAAATAELAERLEQAETKIEVQRKTIADLNQALAAATAPTPDAANTEEPGKKPGSKAKT